MIKNHLISIIQKHLTFAPTADQQTLMGKLSDFVLNQHTKEILLLKGYAGTGKTSMISVFIKALQELNIKTVLLAPTGRAAKVLSSYAETPATTIHKKIYRQKTSKDAFGKFVIDRNLNGNTFFIVDEASMLSDKNLDTSIFGSGNLLEDLINYVYNDKNCKLILVGDTAQLPPVGLQQSMAMNKQFLESYDLYVVEHELREVVRQAHESGILSNATSIRNLISQEKIQNPKFILSGFTDVHRIAGNELLDTLSQAYNAYGRDETIVICRSNKIANKYNQGIRGQILQRDEEMASGDYLMVVKNNYFWLKENVKADFIANGDIVKIKRVMKYYELYGFRFAQAEIILPDYDNTELSVKLLLDTLYSEAPALSFEDNKRLFYTVSEDYAEIVSLKQRYAKVKENEYFNALQVKHANAVTCHKSQGGQWRAVFIDQSYFKDDMLTIEYLKWLYTAFTRATEKVYLVNFGDNFFE